MKRSFIILLLVVGSFAGYSQNLPFITKNELNQHIGFLASDSLKGRKPGTPESSVAAGYIRDQFKLAGLTLLGDNGYQNFDLVTDVKMGEGNKLSLDGKDLVPGEDFTPVPFSSVSSLKAMAVFAGYGFEIDNDSVKWNDYENQDVTGKWVIVLLGAPDAENPTGKFDDVVGERSKVLTARDKGAAGVIFVSGEKRDKDDNLLKISFDKSATTAGIPVLHVRRKTINPVFESFGLSVQKAEGRIIQGMTSYTFSLPVTIEGTTDIIHTKAQTQNIVGVLKGADPVLKDQYVVVGAHYDHLGFGGPGSGSRLPDTVAVHYGADDNASGVAGIIELAGKLASENVKPARSVVFVAFAAEEMGLVGSKYFTDNPLIDLTKVVAMINFDMIGRLKDNNSVTIGGTGTAAESEEILNRLKSGSGLDLRYSPEGYGPSDHAAFYTENIPVFFVSTGAHEDYHTPMDNLKGINTNGMLKVLAFSEKLVAALANQPAMLTFREAGPKTRASHGYSFKVTFGIMPDVSASGNDGLGVDGVRKGGPADLAGLQKGDKIIAIEGKPITNIYDYMGRLKKLEVGQRVSVDVMRKGKKEVFIVEL